MASQTESQLSNSLTDDPSILFGKFLANPPPGEEVVISGLAGKFPDSDDVHEFRDNLFNKRDMVTDDDRRWSVKHPEIPRRMGKLRDIDLFDAGYFGIHHRQATSMDPMGRLLLERAMECVFDAGIHPSELEGTNTGVFVGVCNTENELTWYFDKLNSQMFALTGNKRSMLPNRISYFLKLEGPSLVCDSACSSSLYALEHAYKAMRLGECDKAIVAGVHLCLNAFSSLEFSRLGVLSMDGRCKTFDAEANGYVRSEAVVTIFLQKANAARRIYSTLVHAKTNCDGFIDTGINFPSRELHICLLNELYQECQININNITFLEAHGTGTKVGDSEECQALEEVFAKRKNKPLLIGAVKSNMGHSEPAAGMCSIVKSIIAMETQCIPPNINYKSPRKMKALEEGSFIVVTEKTPKVEDEILIGINSFGFGGANGHVLLKQNSICKNTKRQPLDKLPRLVCVSGRTKEAVDTLLADILQNNCDIEHISLLNEVFKWDIKRHIYRGFSVVIQPTEEVIRSVTCIRNKAPLYIVLCELTTITDIFCGLVSNGTFSNICKQINEVLVTKSLDIYDILSSNVKSIFGKIMEFVVVQICLLETLKELEIEIVDVLGMYLSEVVSAYWHGALTLNEAIECTYIVANASKNSVNSSWVYLIAVDEHMLYQSFLKDDSVVSRISENTVIMSGTTEAIFDYKKLLEKHNVVHYYLGPLLNRHEASFFEPDYLTNMALLKFIKTVPNRAIVMEIGDAVCRKAIQVHRREIQCYVVKDYNTFLLSLGRLYELSHNPQLHKLYSDVKFPVSRGTPMISPKIRWNHRQKWWVSSYNIIDKWEIGEQTIGIMLNDPRYTFIGGHVIDGWNLFPATGYLELVWKTLARMNDSVMSDMKIVFENCKFKRGCSVPKEGNKLELTVMVQRGSGNFEIVEGTEAVVTGRIYEVQNLNHIEALLPLPSEAPECVAKPMLSKDIYKELNLRGYNYNGAFKAVTMCDHSCQVGRVKWDGNWVTFMDNMLQMKILREDTRLLYVPISIKRVSIDAKKHVSYASTFGENCAIPVYCFKDIDTIRSGGIVMSGLIASSIHRRKRLEVPVLEKYQFIPNVSRLSKKQSIMVQMQLVLENLHEIKLKIIELIDEVTVDDNQVLALLIRDVLEKELLVQPNILVLSKNQLNIPNIRVENRKLVTETECSLIVGSNLLQRTMALKLALRSLKDEGFVISRESLNLQIGNVEDIIEVLTIHNVNDEKLVLMRKKSLIKSNIMLNIPIADKKFNWLSKLQMKLKDYSDVVIYCQDEPTNGILGLVNCIRKEPGGQNVQCVFILDEAPEFDPEQPFYKEQLRKCMAVNVYKDGQWGTYRHLLLENLEEIEVEHCYVHSQVYGDISSLRWIEGPLSTDSCLDSESQLIYVYYSALNFRDIMLGSGKINFDVITKDRREQECGQGLEFSGRTGDGKRVMGIVSNGAISTLLASDPTLLWEVPNAWTLEDAATVPVVYITSLYALVKSGRVQKGDTVLIHSGTGGVGQAAIALALFFGCYVFTTVGTPVKREFLKRTFPQLTDRNIANSRDTSFEQHILKETKGRGVDIVINSLAEEKLLASLRCLARGGRFVEIGKYDLQQNNSLSLLLAQKEATFHGCMLDLLFKQSSTAKLKMSNILRDAIAKGAVKPLQRNVFKMHEVEAAFRYMMTGKHMGKNLIQIREEEIKKISVPVPKFFKGTPRYFCNPSKTYIIIGGLGGFGLELADWLVLRGARYLVLTSRTGIKTGYQEYRIRIWKSYGCTVQISTEDITKKEGCRNLIVSANELGPIHALFNLAVVLSDSILENQSEESFTAAFRPKAYGTEYLDEISRKLCPELRDFVVFSSVSCGRGNPGQGNYGMANSVMERICERRKAEGYPALAIQWGAVGDVGLVAGIQKDNKEVEIGGTLQQRISDCLNVLDKLLKQKDATIVSSMVVADKRSKPGEAHDIIDKIADILGVKDLRVISMHSTFAEIGMDSMTAIEIKQILELNLELLLTAQDVKSMTFAKLNKIITVKEKVRQNVTRSNALDILIRLVGDEESANNAVLKITNKKHSTLKSKVLLFPGTGGIATSMCPLSNNLQGEVFCLQYCNYKQTETIEEMAKVVLPHVEQCLSKSQPFTIVGYSFGGVLALEVIHSLEQQGYTGTFVCIDGAPALFEKLGRILGVESDDIFQTTFIIQILSLFASRGAIDTHTEALLKCKSLEERIQLAQGAMGHSLKHSPEYQRAFAISIYRRLKALVAYRPNFRIKSKVKLIKHRHNLVEMDSDDYHLSDFCEHVEVAVFDGDHVTILENTEVADVINKTLATSLAN